MGSGPVSQLINPGFGPWPTGTADEANNRFQALEVEAKALEK